MRALILSATVWAIFYGLFVKAFNFEIWPGIIPEMIPGLIGGGIAPRIPHNERLDGRPSNS